MTGTIMHLILVLRMFFFIEVDARFCANGSLSPLTGYCYHVYDTKVNNMIDGRSICRTQYGGDVPTLFSSDENDFVGALLQASPNSYSAYWLGVTDLAVEGEYRDLMTNNLISYEKWADSEPNNFFNLEDCATILTMNAEWLDYACLTVLVVPGLVCQVLPTINQETGCPLNMLPYRTSTNTECYWFSLEKATAVAASAECTSMGGELAVILNQTQNDFFNSYLPTVGADEAWIGVQQVPYSGTSGFITVEFGSATEASYSNFNDMYTGTENPVCVVMDTQMTGEWTHLACNESESHFICHYHNHSASEMPTNISGTTTTQVFTATQFTTGQASITTGSTTLGSTTVTSTTAPTTIDMSTISSTMTPTTRATTSVTNTPLQTITTASTGQMTTHTTQAKVPSSTLDASTTTTSSATTFEATTHQTTDATTTDITTATRTTTPSDPTTNRETTFVTTIPLSRDVTINAATSATSGQDPISAEVLRLSCLRGTGLSCYRGMGDENRLLTELSKPTLKLLDDTSLFFKANGRFSIWIWAAA